VGRRDDSAARSRQRTRALRFEPLEDRRLLSLVPSVSAAGQVHPTYVPLNASDYTGSASPTGLSPSQIRGAYGLGLYGSGLTFPGTSIQGDGSGQTIAIVDVYDDPFALNDLNKFSAYYGLPQFNAAGDPTFQKLDEYGGASLPGTDPAGAGNDTWEIEESLDIEMAHAMAPMANIILFEANSASDSDLFQGVKTAATEPGVVVVSMSWAGNESSGETSDDADLTTPSGHLGGSATMGGTKLAGGVTFLASAGDEGAYGSTTQTETVITAQYPACSPNVVAVGGTSLYPSGDSYSSESTWGNGTSSGTEGGGGGGISTYESQPTFQTQPPAPNNVVNQYNTYSTTHRVYPDVSADANPNTGVSLYDTWDFGTTNPWFQVGGTSLSCPLWAGIITVADQGRAIEGLGSLNGRTETLPALYNMAAASSYNTYFNDITTGSSIGQSGSGAPSYAPGTGYDLASGLGSPKCAALIPELLASQAAGPNLVITEEPGNTAAGASLSSISVDVEDALGNVLTSDSSNVTLSIGANPSNGLLLGTQTVAAADGVATFTGLSITAAGNGYTLVASDGGDTIATSSPFNISANTDQPSVSAPANASSLSGTKASLSVAGADPQDETLTYAWSLLSLPSGASAPTFSANPAQTTTATFSAAGTYIFLVTIADTSSLSTASSVSYTVTQTLTSLGVTPGPVTLSAGSQEQFSATQLDQFGNVMGTPSNVTWTAASGTITAGGLYTTPASGSSDTVTAKSGSASGTASITIAAPLGWWKLNEGQLTTANDSGSGTADNGTISKGTWLSAADGIDGVPALNFNGSSTVVALGTPTKLATFTDITLSAWIDPASIMPSEGSSPTSSPSYDIIDHRQSSTDDVFLRITGGYDFQVGFVNGTAFHGAAAVVPSQDLSSWVFLAGTFDGQTWRLYLNGQLIASSADTTALINPSGDWDIGAATATSGGKHSTSTTSSYFSGDIADARVYSTALSSAAIAGLETIPPVLSADPANQTVVAGGTATFTAAAGGNPAPGVQWEVSNNSGATFSPIGGATSSTYSFTTSALQNGYEYEAVFSNVAGATTSTAATLTVQSAPSVTVEPANETVVAGGTATFTAAAGGNPAPTVQWNVSNNNGATFSPISGATSTTYSFTSSAAQNGYEYEAVFTNSIGSTTSTSATLTVATAPAVTTNPAGQTVNAGGTATFTAAASGSPAPTVQWEVNTGSGFTNLTDGGVYSGSGTDTLTISEATVTMNGYQYEAVFSNSVSFATSTPATLTVDTAPGVTAEPANQTVVSGGTAGFTVAASGSPAPTVQWEVNTGSGFTNLTDGGVYSGSSTDTLTITGATAAMNGYQYEAVFSNSVSSATSTPATLTVDTAPGVTAEPANQTVAAGGAASFTVAASGNPAPTVQWAVNAGSGFSNLTDGGLYSGSSTDTLTITGATAAMSGYQYEAVFSNSVSSATSTPATLTVLQPPVVTVGNSGAITVICGSSAVGVAPNLTIDDANDGDLLSATVSISGGPLDAGSETLAATTTGTNITASYNSATGVLTLSGNDTLANYQQVIESVTYVDSLLGTTNTGNRTLSFSVTDANNLNSTPVTATVAFDVAPTVTGVYVSGSDWAPAYYTTLTNAGVGSSLGYELASGSGQLSNANVPGWTNLNTITIVFDKPVSGLTLSSFALGDSASNNNTGAGATSSGITITAETNVSSTEAQLTLSGPLPSNKYYVEVLATGVTDAAGATLDGLWTTSASSFAAGSGNGAPGSNFVYEFYVLAGSILRNGRVSTADVTKLRSIALGSDTTATWQDDVNGDDRLSTADVTSMRSKPLTSLGNFPSPILPTSAAGPVESAGTMAAAMSPAAVSVAASPMSGVMAVAASSATMAVTVTESAAVSGAGPAAVSVPAAVEQLVHRPAARPVAADMAWMRQAVYSSDGLDLRHQFPAIQALDAVFAEFGRSL
jgi:hypothetical protein